MPEILVYLATKMPFLFRPGWYRFVHSMVGESFGGDALVVLESEVLRLRFTWDRAQLLMEFQPISGKPSEWFSQGVVRGMLTGDRLRSEVLDDYWARFLADTLPDLEERFRDPERAAETIRELHRQEKLRAKELFG